MNNITTDILIIGAGHAGCEAALAATRLGMRVILATLTLDTIAQMPCNPAIGGVAKGQLVREIDALGGAMGLAIDATGIQFKMLNSAKGFAVRSPRAQADKWVYQHWMKTLLERTPRLEILQEEICELIVENDNIVGAKTALHREINCRAVIVCAGTFIGGVTHIGTHTATGGRVGEMSAEKIGAGLQRLGLPLRRLKTGTCPRLNAQTVDFSRMEIQNGDEIPQPFSYRTEKLTLEQLPCWATWTNENTHKIVEEILPHTPLFSGQITGIGPRYCPSFEVKVARFPEKKKHHIFIEPEGRHTQELYVNGMSTSIAPEFQIKMINSVVGLEDAKIMRFGYAVEYTAIEPRALRNTLETKKIRGLFLAGQINGTSGYEEAAAQGLIAGVNAACKILGRAPLIIGREIGYLGVLIDDMVTRGTDEPYRLFTSRAEYRLALRQDNADLRLGKIAREYNLIDEARAEKITALQSEIAQLQNALKHHGNAKVTAEQMLKNPHGTWEHVVETAPTIFANFSPRAIEQATIEARYDGYLARQNAEIERVQKQENLLIPLDFAYQKVMGLRAEAREKLSLIKPETLGQAMRIAGITPAEIAIIAVYLHG